LAHNFNYLDILQGLLHITTIFISWIEGE